MQLINLIRRLVSRPGRLAYTESKVVVDSRGAGRAFALSGWRDDTSGGAFQPGQAWDNVMSGGRNRRLSRARGVSALKGRTRLDQWRLCIRDGARLEPLDATCEVELRDVMPDLYESGRIRGGSAGLRRIWLRPAPDRCDDCGGSVQLTLARGVDADYAAWSCDAGGETVGREEVVTALAARYGVPVDFD
jgi:hypothetical protein